MGVMLNPESSQARELDRWNRPKNTRDDKGVPGMNVTGFEPFPKMLYKAAKLPSGTVRCMEPPPDPRHFADVKVYEREAILAENFNRQCWKVVHSEGEQQQAFAEGWRATPAEALALHERWEEAIADAAAERAYRDRQMSESAQAEAAAHDGATGTHQPEGPPAPPRRGGWRPRKGPADTTEG